MRMAFEHGAWGVSLYPWHSVNLVPHASTAPICDDDGRATYAMGLWLTVLGHVVYLQRPSSHGRSREVFKIRGPAWSRRRRCWYTISGAGVATEHA